MKLSRLRPSGQIAFYLRSFGLGFVWLRDFVGQGSVTIAFVGLGVPSVSIAVIFHRTKHAGIAAAIAAVALIVLIMFAKGAWQQFQLVPRAAPPQNFQQNTTPMQINAAPGSNVTVQNYNVNVTGDADEPGPGAGDTKAA